MTGQSLPVAVVNRWPRRAAYGAAGLAVLLPTSTAGASLFLANQVLNVPASRYPVWVRGASAGLVTLTRTADTERPIPLGFVWADGHARLGPVVTKDKAIVVREVDEVTRGTLRTGIRGYSSSYVFAGDPSARGLAFTDVTIRGELGDMPAWLVPPTGDGEPSDTWIIAVHGRGAPRGEALRVLPTLAASGHPTLVITYRNDVGAPQSPDRRYHLGDTEWRDVAAAVRYARSQGATGIILCGWSMGGGMVLNLLRHEPPDHLRAVILDCPVVDWATTLRRSARNLGLPPPWVWATLRLVERRIGVRLKDLDHRSLAAELAAPTLLFVDHDDGTVAPRPALEFAHARPELVTLVETRGAGHCRSWNLDPTGYEVTVAEFLKSLS